MKLLASRWLALPLLSVPAAADVLVDVTLLGSVSTNQVASGPLSGILPGDRVMVRFQADSGSPVAGATAATLGYAVETHGFELLFQTLGPVPIPLETPFPSPAYFVVTDDDPDRFVLSADVDTLVPLPLSEPGSFGQLGLSFALDYAAATLASTDLLAAQGTYWAVGLESAAWTIDDGGSSAMTIDFQAIRISTLSTETYCTAGTSASGCQAAISAAGVPSAFLPSGFFLFADGVEGSKSGLFLFGTNGRQANPWGNGSSFQCVAPPVARTPLFARIGTNGACDGAYSRDLNAFWCASCPEPNKNPGPGALVQAQFWYRDPLSTSNQLTSFSDAIEFSVTP